MKDLTSVFSLFSTGITIVTNGTNKKQFFGCTVNSFSSLSLKPPKFLFCLGNENLNLKTFKLNSPLNVNFLAKSQLKLSNKFVIYQNLFLTKFLCILPVGKRGNSSSQNS